MRRMLIALAAVLLTAACSGGGAPPAASGGVVPYHPVTPSPTATLTPIPPLAQVILPSATPVSYTVRSGDTMSGIASRFGIRLADLQAANPGVDPSILPLGTVLVIPQGGSAPGEPSPTPATVIVRQVRCDAESTGGLWCFALLENGNGTTVENLSAQFTLLDAAGNEVASKTAYGLLNILPAGEHMPLAVHFAPPVETNVRARVQVLSAILLRADDARYIPIAIEALQVQVDAPGTSAVVAGTAMPLMLDGQVQTLWILGTAYDAHGNVLGVRRWEAAAPIGGGVRTGFSFNIYSLAGTIANVELLAEARP